jgi:peroxiredoxin
VSVPSGIQMPASQVGDLAPDFDLPALIGGVKKRFRLSDCRGKENVVLAFYPLNWEPASEKQLVQYQEKREKLAAYDAMVVAVGVDSIMNTTAWEREIGPFDFVLCSDFWPHGEVSRKYGVLREKQPDAGIDERAVFVIDKSGRIQFRKVYEDGKVPEVDETLSVLAKL